MINGFHHNAITTPDLDRAVAFYRDLLGFEQRMDASWEVGSKELDAIVGLEDSAARFAMLWAGNTHLELFEYQSPTAKERDATRRVCDHGLTHLCLDVTDVDGEYERLKAAGMKFNTPPQSAFGVRTTYGEDPDGNVIELQEIFEGSVIPRLS